MIVSHQHKFIFLKTRKTAGTSIEVALSRFCDESAIITAITPEDEVVRQEMGFRGPQHLNVPFNRYRVRDWKRLIRGRRRVHFYNHINASMAKRYLGDAIWNSYFKFSFDRNPWDRLISAYYWQVSRMPSASLEFKDFLANQPRHLMSNFSIYSIDGSVAMDFVGQYENLTDDLRLVLDRLGISDPVDLPRLKGKSRTDKRPYREIITSTQREVIANLCAQEIALMGYRFE